MKIIVKEPINKELLGERFLERYKYKDNTGPSNDGMRGGVSFTVYGKTFGNIKNEEENKDGTYTYEYISKDIEDGGGSEKEKNPENQRDLDRMIDELLFIYNVHEFSTDMQETIYSIKDYYISLEDVEVKYNKDEDVGMKYSYYKSKKDERYNQKKDGNTSQTMWASDRKSHLVKTVISDNLNDVEEKINKDFSKIDYIKYCLGEDVIKCYDIRIGLDNMKDGESINNFLNRIPINKPRVFLIDEAIKEGKITYNDLREYFSGLTDINASCIPAEILDKLFEENKELINNCNEEHMDINILRKYKKDYNVENINPKDLNEQDLDNVLSKIIQSKYILGEQNGQTGKERENAYYEYLRKFIDIGNKELLKKIIPVMNTSNIYFFKQKAVEYINEIKPEVLRKEEIRDVLLNTDEISLKQLLKYNFQYDKESSKKLLKLVEKQSSEIDLEELNCVLENAIKYNISEEEMLETLGKKQFNVRFPASSKEECNEELEKLKSYNTNGTLNNLIKNQVMNNRDFYLFELINEDEREFTELYHELVNNKENETYVNVYELLRNYSNVSILFSNMLPEVKELTKKLIIEKMDEIEQLQENPVGYNSEMRRIMKILNESFELSKEDFKNIYRKVLNNGACQKDIFKEIEIYLPENKTEEFETEIKKENIYPNPKYFWLKDRSLTRIPIDFKTENRASIKKKIQDDGTCFRTKIKTDMKGISQDGKEIKVDNLSKWLFGVPGRRGHLTINKQGNYIQMPTNTPKEAVNLIEGVLKQSNRYEKNDNER